MVIQTKPYDVKEGLGGKIEWSHVPHKTKPKSKYKNKFFLMQQLSAFAIFSSFRNKKYRILLHNTKKFMVPECAEHKYVVAEDNSLDQIISDWHKLVKYVQPLLEETYKENKRITLENVANMLQDPEGALNALKLKHEHQKNNRTFGERTETETETLEDEVETTEDVQEPNEDELPRTELQPRRKEKKTDRKPILSNEELTEAIQRFTNLVSSLKEKSNVLGTPRENEKIKQMIKQQLKEVNEVDYRIGKYFRKMDRRLKKKKITEEEGKYIKKLEKGYSQLKPLKDALMLNPNLQKLQEEINDVWQEHSSRSKSTSSFAARDEMYKNKLRPERQLQAQMQQPARINQWQQAMINTELIIAKETRDELIAIEQEFDELHEMVKDFHMQVREQDVGIRQISGNISRTNEKVEEGIGHFKKAKDYQRFGFM